MRGRLRVSFGGEQSGARLGGRKKEKILQSFFKRGMGIYINYYFRLLGRYRRAGQAGLGEEGCWVETRLDKLTDGM